MLHHPVEYLLLYLMPSTHWHTVDFVNYLWLLRGEPNLVATPSIPDNAARFVRGRSSFILNKWLEQASTVLELDTKLLLLTGATCWVSSILGATRDIGS